MILNLVMDKANYKYVVLVCMQVAEEGWFHLAISVRIFFIIACCFHALRPKREKETHNSQMNGKLGTDFSSAVLWNTGLRLCWCVAQQQSEVIISLAVSIRFNFSNMLHLPKCLVSVTLMHWLNQLWAAWCFKVPERLQERLWNTYANCF